MDKTEPPIRVLIADDHSRMRDGIRKLIARQFDMEVIGEAENGRVAVDLTKGLHPDVLVLDIQMPELDGIEVARYLKAELFPVHILILSAYLDYQFIQAAMDLKISGYLSKDEAPQELVKSIRCVAHGEIPCYSRQALKVMGMS
jgi:two-component system, NarL family, response regulator NreC